MKDQDDGFGIIPARKYKQCQLLLPVLYMHSVQNKEMIKKYGKVKLDYNEMRSVPAKSVLDSINGNLWVPKLTLIAFIAYAAGLK